MRNIIVTRGIPGSGKSSFLRKKGLEPWVISTDSLRLLYSSPTYSVNGDLDINQNYNNEVFKLAYNLIEQRMINRELIIFDATNIEIDKFGPIRKLSKEYRYNVILLDFTDVSLETCLLQNKNRQFKVSDEVILKFYERLQDESNQKIPSWLNVVKPNELDDYLEYKIQDFNQWKKIHHIGDIHGCYSVLNDYIDGKLKEDELYIFLGDYLDRGIENLEVLRLISRISTMKNVILLEGNHEEHLWKYANDKPIHSKEFVEKTIPQIKDFKKQDIRRLYRKLRTFVYYTYKDKKVFVSHGGLTFLREDLYKLPEKCFITGIGDYNTDTNLYWDNAVKETYQVHGHRNVDSKPIMSNTKTFNLEGKVEFGGDLRVLTLDENGFKEHYLNNTIFDKLNNIWIDVDLSQKEYLEMLRHNNTIVEKTFSDNISSFNFSRNTFYNQDWNLQNIKARGLFLNTKSYEIIARSYDKFFNVGEIESNNNLLFDNNSKNDFIDNIKFPLVAYQKENGFLGITGYDSDNNKCIVASKSTIEGKFKKLFSDLLKETLKDNYDKFFEDLKDLNLSGIFEVIDIEEDPHIVSYEKSKIVLLDLVKREQKFSKLSYEELVDFAKKYNIEVKEKRYVFSNKEEFIEFYEKCKISNEKIEGYVLEDSENFMFKIKLPYYSYWKNIRNILEKIRNILTNSSDFDIDVILNNYNIEIETQNIIKYIVDNNLLYKDIIYIQEKWHNSTK